MLKFASSVFALIHMSSIRLYFKHTTEIRLTQSTKDYRSILQKLFLHVVFSTLSTRCHPTSLSHAKHLLKNSSKKVSFQSLHLTPPIPPFKPKARHRTIPGERLQFTRNRGRTGIPSDLLTRVGASVSGALVSLAGFAVCELFAAQRRVTRTKP